MTVSAPIIEIPDTSTLTNLMTAFCSPTSTPKIMQDTIHSLTHEIITAATSHDPALSDSPTTMIPILRGALPMFVAAQPLLPSTSCILARCSKTKGTEEVVVDWLGRRPFPAQADDGKIIILDTIVATGDTVVKLCEELWEMGGEQRPQSVVVWCCYAAPEALERVARCPVVEYVVVGKRAERCDERGYLVPYTNGDIGDKIYGKSGDGDGERVMIPVVVAEGEDEEGVLAGVDRLRVENGGLWRVTEDGLAIEREIQFSGFNKAWAFMKQVADAASKHRHHPEWTNVYNTVSIRWTTHDRKGLTNLDVKMAQLCDSYI